MAFQVGPFQPAYQQISLATETSRRRRHVIHHIERVALKARIDRTVRIDKNPRRLIHD